MSDPRRVRAEIISGTSRGLREAIRQIEPITAGLSADELGTLSIIVGLEAQIRKEQRPELYIVREEVIR